MFIFPGLDSELYQAEILINIAADMYKTEEDQNEALLKWTGVETFRRSRSFVLFLLKPERRNRVLSLIQDIAERNRLEEGIAEIEQELKNQNQRIQESMSELIKFRKQFEKALENAD